MLKTVKFKLYRIIRYEFWPYLIFYFPMYFYYIYLAIKAKGLTFITNVNPAIKHGGITGESKEELMGIIPKDYLPKTCFFDSKSSFEHIKDKLNQNNLFYPLVLKPDEGERGKGIHVLKSDIDLSRFLKSDEKHFFHIQKFIDYDFEAGVFIVDHPKKGFFLSSITTKDFFTITGDGQNSLEDIIRNNPRYLPHFQRVKKNRSDLSWNRVPSKEEAILIDPIANHSRGAIFRNGNHFITDKNTLFFKNLVKNMDGIFYGRFDIKARSSKSLQEGEDIKIIEFNGAMAEPSHIYDPDENIFNAYKDLMKHWSWAKDISIENKRNGFRYSSKNEMIKLIYGHFFSS